jgi:hypothetical protein
MLETEVINKFCKKTIQVIPFNFNRSCQKKSANHQHQPKKVKRGKPTLLLSLKYQTSVGAETLH